MVSITGKYGEVPGLIELENEKGLSPAYSYSTHGCVGSAGLAPETSLAASANLFRTL